MAAHPIVPAQIYVKNFIALTMLMTATVLIAQLPLGMLNLPVALLIAITKATLIVLIFMNVKYSDPLTWVFAAAGFLWLLILIGITITDFVFYDFGSPYTAPLPYR